MYLFIFLQNTRDSYVWVLSYMKRIYTFRSEGRLFYAGVAFVVFQ